MTDYPGDNAAVAPFGPWIAAILFTYALGLCIFYPRVFTAFDESLYVEQAAAFARGQIALPNTMPRNDYPPGTSELQTPFVLIGGWRAAAWASVVCMATTVVVLARWLGEAGYSPGFALLFLAYPPTLVFGRLATSDVPSAAVLTLGLWLFWTGEGSRWKWLLAGLVAGVSLLFRETDALIFGPFVLGAVLRRERHWDMLIAGGLAGMGVRLLTFHFLFGSAMYTRDPGSWSLAAALDSAPLYGLALLVLVPGGLVAVATYRGKRRAELIAAVTLFVAAYVFHDYSGQGSGGLARLAVACRYFIPVVPLIAIAWADAVSRRVGRDWPKKLVPVACWSILIGAFAVHPVIDAWSSREAAIMQDIYASTAAGSTLISDDGFDRKYISPVYGPRVLVGMTGMPANELAGITRQHPSTYIVAVSRYETTTMSDFSKYADGYLRQAQQNCQLDPVQDRYYGSTRRLRIWKVRACNRRS